ncbi:MAG: pentose kinase [Clostridia bacterium]|nr:pentose kinase [Oscillospiraceae bacterium]MBO5298880.1 pentose kinase [Clostridia bacterium]
MKYVIAYDLGTGGIKTSIFGEDGISKGFSFLPYDTSFPKEGFREQRPDTWWDAVKTTTSTVLLETGIDPNQIVSLAVSGHSLGALPIGYNGQLLCEYVPIWNDSRAKAQAEAFFEKTSEDEWYLSTGNGFPPELYSLFKILWYKDNMPEVYENTDKFIGTKDYINYKMTGVLATDRSYASGCGVFSLKDNRYNEKYIDISGIDRNKLPDILNSTDIVGNILPEVAEELGLSGETLVCAGGVDNACMALGAGCTDDGDVYTSLGTSAWIAVCDRVPVVDTENRPYVFAHCLPDKYVSAVAIFSAGNSLRWVRDKFFADFYSAELAGGAPSYKEIDSLAENSPAGSNKVFFIPTLAGGSSLDKSADAKGCYFGLDLMHTRSDIARATLEGIALNLRVALDVLKKYVTVGENMLIVGGGSKSPLWRQIFADVYEMNIATARVGQDAGSFGAAAVAAVGAGVWTDFEKIKSIVNDEKLTVPSEELSSFYNSLIPSFRKLLDISSDVGDLLKNI